MICNPARVIHPPRVQPKTELPAEIRIRLRDLWRETGDEDLLALSQSRVPLSMSRTFSPRNRMDAVSSCLMATFAATGNPRVFDFLVELNHESLLQAIRQKLRGSPRVDPQDVLQEALLNIFRYRKSFRRSGPGAFRRWGHRIAINMACRLFRTASRGAISISAQDVGSEVADENATSPYRAASHSEQAEVANLGYMIYLNAYLQQFRLRSSKEQRALTLVEVEGRSYREAAAALGIRRATLKMVIFRARRRIHLGVGRDLARLSEVL